MPLPRLNLSILFASCELQVCGSFFAARQQHGNTFVWVVWVEEETRSSVLSIADRFTTSADELKFGRPRAPDAFG